MQKSEGPSVIMTANGTTHTTEEATVYVCDLDMFVQVQFWRNHLWYSRRVICAKKRLLGWMASRSAIIFHQEWEKIDSKTDNHILLVVPDVQATPHQTKALDNRKRPQAVGGHERTELPEWLQPFTHGLIKAIFKFDRRISSRRGHTTSSNCSFRSPSSKTSFQQIWRVAQFIHPLSHRPELRCMRTHERDESVMQKNSGRSGGQNKYCWKIRGYDNSGPQGSQWRSRLHHRYAVAVQDLATQWIQSYPCNREVPDTAYVQKKTQDPRTDNFLELIEACEELQLESWKRSTSHRPETHRIVERAVRRVKEGTSPALVQSGLQESWWAVAMECYCYLRETNGRRLVNVGSVHHLKGRLFHLKQK